MERKEAKKRKYDMQQLSAEEKWGPAAQRCRHGWVPVFPELIAAMRQRGMTSTQILGAIALVYLRRGPDGFVCVSSDTLTHYTGLDQSYLVRFVKSLRQFGIEISFGKRGRGHANEYHLERFLASLDSSLTQYQARKAKKDAAGAAYRGRRRMTTLKLEVEAARAAGDEAAEEQALEKMEKLANQIDAWEAAANAA